MLPGRQHLYGKVSSISEIVFDRKSEYSFKEVLTPISQTLFFFTEDQCKEADPPKKGAVLFLRSCDLHALKRLDDLYLHNGPADYYYKRIRDNIKIVLMGCPNDCGKVRLHDFGIMGMTEPQLDPKGIKY